MSTSNIRPEPRASGTGSSCRTTPWGEPTYVLVGALSHSSKFRGWFSESMDQPHLVVGIDEVLRRLGGTPKRWRVDRMATVISPGTDQVQRSFAPVAKHYGVGVDPCPPRHGNRKGVVEKNDPLPHPTVVAHRPGRLDRPRPKRVVDRLLRDGSPTPRPRGDATVGELADRRTAPRAARARISGRGVEVTHRRRERAGERVGEPLLGPTRPRRRRGAGPLAARDRHDRRRHAPPAMVVHASARARGARNAPSGCPSTPPRWSNVVLGAFNTDRPCRRKVNRPPSTRRSSLAAELRRRPRPRPGHRSRRLPTRHRRRRRRVRDDPRLALPTAPIPSRLPQPRRRGRSAPRPRSTRRRRRKQTHTDVPRAAPGDRGRRHRSPPTRRPAPVRELPRTLAARRLRLHRPTRHRRSTRCATSRRAATPTTPPTCCSSARPASARPCSPSRSVTPPSTPGCAPTTRTAADLAARCRRAAVEGRWATTMRFFSGPSVLIIDELGYLPMPAEDANALFQVITRRYLKGSIILTTNRGVARLGRHLRRHHRRRRHARPAPAPLRRHQHRRRQLPHAPTPSPQPQTHQRR